MAEQDRAGIPDKPGPIRPRGVSPRLSLILFIALAAALFLGYRYISDSDMYRTAEAFVRQNEEIRAAFGEVRRCHLWYPFKVDFPDDVPRILLTLRIEGAKADTKAFVTLTREGRQWRIVAASYEDGRGQIRPLPIPKTGKTGAAKGDSGRPSATQSGPKTKHAPEGKR